MKLDLAYLQQSWRRILVAEGKSPATIDTYMRSVAAYLKWGGQSLTKSEVQTFIADQLEGGSQPKTVTTRLAALRAFAAWLAEEGELDTNTLLGVKQPKIAKHVVPALTDDEIRLLIAACKGKTFADRRDEAIVRLMVETTLRASELTGLATGDIDLDRGLAVVRRGKGGKGRVVPFGPQTAAVLDRYLRVRRTHRHAADDSLWLGAGSVGTFGYYALRQNLQARAKKAGVEGFHLHRLRHTAATRWLRAGGSEGGLMAVAGWTSRSMLDRYVAASASERAADEARRLQLGDF